MLILKQSNCIVTTFGVVTLRKQLFSAPVESGLPEDEHGIARNMPRIIM
jgi:hypothetical protein